jgi:hypothetical protein
MCEELPLIIIFFYYLNSLKKLGLIWFVKLPRKLLIIFFFYIIRLLYLFLKEKYFI